MLGMAAESAFPLLESEAGGTVRRNGRRNYLSFCRKGRLTWSGASWLMVLVMSVVTVVFGGCNGGGVTRRRGCGKGFETH